jgi:hypothetical protein
MEIGQLDTTAARNEVHRRPRFGFVRQAAWGTVIRACEGERHAAHR